MEHRTIIVLIIIAIICAAIIAWQHMDRAAEKMTMPEPKTPAPDEDRQAREDHRARLAAYNDTEHEACNDFGSDEYRRRLNAGMTNYRAASMEPFCGEGKKLTEKEKREELERLNLPGWANVPEHLRPDPYTRMGP